MAYSISVIGDKESILSFKAVGIKVFDCSTRSGALKALKAVSEESAIIYITEDVYRLIREEIRFFVDKPQYTVYGLLHTLGRWQTVAHLVFGLHQVQWGVMVVHLLCAGSHPTAHSDGQQR